MNTPKPDMSGPGPDTELRSLNTNTTRPATEMGLLMIAPRPAADMRSFNISASRPATVLKSINMNTTRPATEMRSLNMCAQGPSTETRPLRKIARRPSTDMKSYNISAKRPATELRSLNMSTTRPDTDMRSLNMRALEPHTEIKSLNMSTPLIGHCWNFIWTFGNVSHIGKVKKQFCNNFKFDPKCDVMWETYAFLEVPNTLVFGYQPKGRCPKINRESTISIYNTRDELYGTRSYDWRSVYYLDIAIKKQGNDEEAITTEDGRTFEIIDDTLVIKGFLVVSNCCPRSILDEPQ